MSNSSIILPGDSRYSTLVRGFNLRWVGNPKRIVACVTPAQVVSALQDALDDGLRVTVRGGGHCYENFVSGNDGGVILDLSPMNQSGRDPVTGWYFIDGGATLWNVYRRLFVEHGVTLPGGSCASVGAGGHITGGGYGLLSRLHGLTVDWLHAVDVVVVDRAGRVRKVRATRDDTDPALQNLFWAHTGGGGGNFGIVTRFWFRDLPQAPERAYVLNLAWDWPNLDVNAFARIVTNFGAFFAANSAPDSPYSGLFALLHLTQMAANQLVLVAQYVGPRPNLLVEFASAIRDGAPAAVASRTAVGHHHTVSPTTDMRELPWLYATQTLNGTGPNQRGKYKSAYMKQPFPGTQIETIWKYLHDSPHQNPQALLQVDSYGCQINRIATDATAVPQRSSIVKLQYQTYWTNPHEDKANLNWIRAFYHDMYGASGSGTRCHRWMDVTSTIRMSISRTGQCSTTRTTTRGFSQQRRNGTRAMSSTTPNRSHCQEMIDTDLGRQRYSIVRPILRGRPMTVQATDDVYGPRVGEGQASTAGSAVRTCAVRACPPVTWPALVPGRLEGRSSEPRFQPPCRREVRWVVMASVWPSVLPGANVCLPGYRHQRNQTTCGVWAAGGAGTVTNDPGLYPLQSIVGHVHRQSCLTRMAYPHRRSTPGARRIPTSPSATAHWSTSQVPA